MPAFEAETPNPFVRYRWLLDSYRVAIGRGWSDADFVSLIKRLDEAVGLVEASDQGASNRSGFTITPLTRQVRLATAVSLPTDRLWIKDDTRNVGGSHKARHLFGVLVHLAVAADSEGELAIASCGNAALAAAVLAKAAERPLRVFIPTWADPLVVANLERLEARIEVSERRPGEAGDPTYHRFTEAVARGATPFSVQGTVTPNTIDGGRTIGWELAEQLALARVGGTVHLFVQVGGGALATSVWRGVNDGIREQWLSVRPILHTVQTEAVAPLNRAWRRLLVWTEEQAMALNETESIDEAVAHANERPGDFMWPWEEVETSAASGILDDMTYDWLPVIEGMLRSGGKAHVVDEKMILKAHDLAHENTEINVDATGSAGLAALLDPAAAIDIGNDDHVVIFFTGVDRNEN